MVRIVHALDRELGRRRNIDADANQSLVQQLAVSSPPLAGRRDVRSFAVGSVVRAEHRIEPARLVEAAPDGFGRHRPALRGTMAREAAAAVGAERLEERIGQIDRAVHVDGSNGSRVVGRDERERVVLVGQRVPLCGHETDASAHTHDHPGTHKAVRHGCSCLVRSRPSRRGIPDLAVRASEGEDESPYIAIRQDREKYFGCQRLPSRFAHSPAWMKLAQ